MIAKLSVQYAKARMNPLFTHWTQRFNEGESLTEDINLPKIYRWCFGNVFLIVVFTAFTHW